MRAPVISLGAGVQSSVLLLMAVRGELEVKPDLAVFADTQREPKAVYDWLGLLRDEAARGGVELCVVTTGDLGAEVLAHARGDTKRATSLPYFLDNDGVKGKVPRRGCTRDYKINVVKRELRRRGYGPKRPVDALMGVTVDEVTRMHRDPETDWYRRAYPFLEMGFTRDDCQRWLVAHGYGEAPRSACTFCPFHSDFEWRRLRDESPGEFAEAVEFDRAIRHLPTLDKPAYLHRSLKPLDEVDLSTPEDHGQGTLDDECEGGCFI